MRGRERTYFEHFWNDFAADKAHSIPEADRRAYTTAYARPGRMHAGWAYFVSFPEAAKDFADLSRTKLTMPESSASMSATCPATIPHAPAAPARSAQQAAAVSLGATSRCWATTRSRSAR